MKLRGSIPQTQFGRTGLQVGRLGLGTWQIGDQKISPRKTADIIAALLDAGGNVIDTSDNYDNAEAIIGQALRHFDRRDIVLVTKCGDYTQQTFDRETGLSTNHPDYKHARLNFTPDVITRNIDESLDRLGVDYLDVVLLHTPYMPRLLEGDCIEAIIKAKDQGKARFIGYSGDNEEIIYCSQVPEFDVMMMSLSITDARNTQIPLAVAQQAEMATMIKRPIANTFWRDDIYPVAYEYAKDYRARAQQMGISPNSFGLPNTNEGWLHLAFSFVLGFPVDVIVPGTTRLDHMLQNINIVSNLQLNRNLQNEVLDVFFGAQEPLEYGKDGKPWLGLE
jgi:aryl-alcohol dehydrogenase-like predicted oxidoreductase